MRKPSPDKLKQFDLKSQMLQHSSAVVDFFKEQGFADEFTEEIFPETRSEVAPPPKP